MDSTQLELQFDFNDAASLHGKPRVLSYTQALALFDRMADRADIAFGYAQDGCYARAHIMCQQMMAEGHKPSKAWAFEGDRSMYVDHPGGGRTYWCYHVSAALPVLMPNGKVETLVFDPGLFDGPVPLQQWGDIMHAPPENLEITPFGVAPKGRIGDYEPVYKVSTTPDTDTIAQQVMRDYMKWNGTGPRFVFPTLARQTLVEQLGPIARQGLTWTSLLNAPAPAPPPAPVPVPEPEQLVLSSVPKQAPGTIAELGDKFAMAVGLDRSSTGIMARVNKFLHKIGLG